jgi:hypothetical protein
MLSHSLPDMNRNFVRDGGYEMMRRDLRLDEVILLA